MTFKNKLVVLNGVTGGIGGVLKMQSSDKTYCSLDLKREIPEGSELLLELDGRALSSLPIEGKFELQISAFDTVQCLVCFEGVPLLFGGSPCDKKRCLMLAEKSNKVPFGAENEMEKQVSDEDSEAPENEGGASPETPEEVPLESEKDAADEPLTPPESAPETTPESTQESTPEETQNKVENDLSQGAVQPAKLAKTGNAGTTAKAASRAPQQKGKARTNTGKTLSTEPQRHAEAFVLDGDFTYGGDDYYRAVKPQLDEMFVRYPEYAPLQECVPNSHWVKVETDEDFYVVGVAFDEADEPLFIAYGIHGNAKLSPPEDVRDACKWQGVGDADDGFWIVYQDARTGKCLVEQ